MYRLLLDSFVLMPSVLLRTLPVAIVTALIFFGLIQNTANPMWQALFVVLLAQPCIAIVRMAALRAALVAAGRTTPPTIDHLLRAQLRLAYGNLLPINIVQMVAATIILLLISSDLSRALGEAFINYARTSSTAGFESLMEEFSSYVQVGGWVATIIAAVGFGVMGTAMAGTAANAAEKRPRHDITFGVGYNFWKLTVLYYVAQIFNGIVVVLLTILVMAILTVGDVDLAVYVLPAALTFYVSLHFAFTAAGAALSYGDLLDYQAEVRDYIQRNIAGPETSASALREMRRARQAGN